MSRMTGFALALLGTLRFAGDATALNVNAHALARARAESLTLPMSQAGETYLVVVSGIGGEPRFSDAFLEWGSQIVEAAGSKYGVPRENIVFLAEKAGGAGVTGESRREHVEKAVADVAARATPADLLFVVLIGHGSFRGSESRINLPGPDLSAQDFAAMLDGVKARVAFANTASASGEWAKTLSGENRAIVTSTKSGNERNESVFGRFFAQAFAEDVADADKDGRVSLLEAYDFARSEVRRHYEGDGLLLTEHAQIEDTGDGKPGEEAGPDGTEGALAARMYLGAGGASGSAMPADAGPELRALYDTKRELEEKIAALRSRRASMEEAEYQAELEPLLIELARTDQQIRRLSGTGGS